MDCVARRLPEHAFLVIAPSRNFKVIYLNSFDFWCYVLIQISIGASLMVFGILVPDFQGVDIGAYRIK